MKHFAKYLRHRRFWVLSVFLLVGILGFLVYSSVNSFENKLVETARTALLNELKSPSTAKFVGGPGEIEQGFMRDGNPCGMMVEYDGHGPEDMEKYFFTVAFTVDAQNGYGAMMREDYICVIQPDGNWCTDTEAFQDIRDFCDDPDFIEFNELFQ